MSGMDGQDIFNAAVREPAPPPPDDTAEGGEGDDGFPCCELPALIVRPDGSLSAPTRGGTLLVAWFCVATFVTLWTVLAAAWSALGAAWASMSLGALLILAVLSTLLYSAVVSVRTARRLQRHVNEQLGSEVRP